MSDKAFTIITNTENDDYDEEPNEIFPSRSFTVLSKPRFTLVPQFNDNMHIREAHPSFAVLGKTYPQSHIMDEDSSTDSRDDTSVPDSSVYLSDIEEEELPFPHVPPPSKPPAQRINYSIPKIRTIPPSPQRKKYPVPRQPKSWIPHRISYNSNPSDQDHWISKIDYYQQPHKKKWTSGLPPNSRKQTLPSLPKPKWTMEPALRSVLPKPTTQRRLALTDERLSKIPEHLFQGGYKQKLNPYDKEDPRVPFNTPEVLSSSSDSSSEESSPEMPLRKEKVRKAMRKCRVFFKVDKNDDDEYQHLDFTREDHLASYCRTKLNRVTARTLYLALMEMRRMDYSKDQVLSQLDINRDKAVL